MKKHLFFGARLSINIYLKINKLTHYTHHTLNCAVFRLENFNVDRETCTTALSVFLFGFNPQNNLSLCRGLIFLLRIGTHPSNTVEQLLCYNLYHEEIPFYLDVRPQTFNRHFIIY